jgi:hypothetical protein
MTSKHPDTSHASDELVSRASAGDHSHWSPFDLKLEGARYQSLHEIVAAPAFDSEAASTVYSEILAFARGFGDGQADSYLADYGHLASEDFDEDSLASIHRDELFSSYDETEYFEYVTKSEGALSKASATPEAKSFVRNLTVDALDAFCVGRDRRIERSNPIASVAP